VVKVQRVEAAATAPAISRPQEAVVGGITDDAAAAAAAADAEREKYAGPAARLGNNGPATATTNTNTVLAARGERQAAAARRRAGRGLHSSTFQLNLSALYGIGGARMRRVARIKGVFRVCRVGLCVRHCSS
jgi:hypothetical protein